MTIEKSQVQVGNFFMTPSDQLRKVTKLVKDDKKRTRVHYLCKSGKIANREFVFGPNKSNPPLLATFVKACDRLLSAAELRQLRIAKVITSGE